MSFPLSEQAFKVLDVFDQGWVVSVQDQNPAIINSQNKNIFHVLAYQDFNPQFAKTLIETALSWWPVRARAILKEANAVPIDALENLIVEYADETQFLLTAKDSTDCTPAQIARLRKQPADRIRLLEFKLESKETTSS